MSVKAGTGQNTPEHSRNTPEHSWNTLRTPRNTPEHSPEGLDPRNTLNYKH